MTGLRALVQVRLLALIAVLLAATAMSPMVEGWRWYVELVVVLLVATFVDVLASWLVRPGVGALLAIVAAALAVNACYAGSASLLGVIPTGASISTLVGHFTAGASAVYELPAPLPSSDGVRCLIVSGSSFAWWGVAVLVGASSSPALAGVPMLAILLPSAALSYQGVPGWSFALGAVGYLILLVGGDARRAGDWGRLVSPRTGSRAGPLGWLALGVEPVVLIAVATALALLVPNLTPSMSSRLVPPGDNDRNQGTIAVLNPILNLHDDLTSRTNDPILTFRTDERNPGPIRVVSVDAFDGSTWHPTYGALDRDDEVQQGLPRAPGLADDVRTEPATMTVEIQRLQQSWLPTPYPPTRVDIEGPWLFNPTTLNIVGDHVATTPGQRYTVQYDRVLPTPQQLAAAPAVSPGDFSEFTSLPPELPGLISATAEDVAGDGDAYDQAMKLQTWLRSSGGFSYSEQAPPENGSGAIADFLQRRSGYCVHFASTMAVMARTLGIPARVGVGFQPGVRQPDGTFQVRQRDAHAWPELYFEGAGWLAFEPTPAVHAPTPPGYANQAVENPAPAPSTSTTTTTTTSTSAAPTTATPAPTTSAPPATRGEQFAVLARRFTWPLLALLGLGLLAGLLPAVVARLARRRRWQRATSSGQLAEAGWHELLDDLDDLGLPVPATMTVRQVSARLARDLDDDTARSLGWLSGLVEGARYAPEHSAEPAEAVSADRMRTEVGTIVRAVAEQRGRRPLWRARLRPVSGARALAALRQEGWRALRGRR